MRLHNLFVVLLLIIAIPLIAQEVNPTKPDTAKPAEKKNDKKKEWDVTAAHGPTKEIAFTTTEGTWMNLDVSPDGKEIVFDLLGDIYLMPLTGGEAKLLSGGPAFEAQPRFSPDGKRISFTSDPQIVLTSASSLEIR